MTSDLRNAVGAEQLGVGEEVVLLVTVRSGQQRGLGNLGDDGAVVGLLAAAADAALNGQPATRPHVDRQTDAVPVLDLLAVVAGQCEVVVRGDGRSIRVQVEESIDQVGAPIGQSRVAGRHDAKRAVVSGAQAAFEVRVIEHFPVFNRIVVA